LKLQAAQQPTYRVQPLVKSDKTRRERREQQSFATIYKAQTTKRERRLIMFVCFWFLLLVGVQIGIATRDITGPMYLADLVK